MRIESALSQPQIQTREEQPVPSFVVEPAQRWGSQQIGELWEYRELLYFLVWRNIKVRYKQTALGVLWVVLQPLLMTLLFSIIFGVFAGMPSNGTAYPVFVFAALAPWQLFAHALSSSHTLVTDQQLISKVYFPRLILPVSNVLAGAVDFAVTLVVLFIVSVSFGIPITPTLFMLPLFILLILAAAISMAILLSALNAQFRDVQYAIPFLTQLWFFATPIAYASDLIPAKWRLIYALNPMVGIVDGFRFALLGQEPSLAISPYLSVLATVLLLISALVYFNRVEQTIADII